MDPLPFLALHHLQAPVLLLRNLVTGTPWTKLDLLGGRPTGPACPAASQPALTVCHHDCHADCLADQKGVPLEKVQSWTPYPGGAPANVVAALGRLKVNVSFLTAIGEDNLGRQMIELLESRGVDLLGVQKVSAPTRDVLVTRDMSGERTFAGFGAAANEEYADAMIEADKLPLDAIRSATALVTGTLGLAFPTTAKAMHHAVGAATSSPCCVLVDVNWRPVFWAGQEDTARDTIFQYTSKADVLKVELEEAEWLYGVPAAEALEDPQRVLKAVGTAHGVLVTAGDKGCSYAFRGTSGTVVGRVPVLDIQVSDTTGAGDAFLSGFLYSMVKAGGLQPLSNNPKALRKAVEFGSACGAFTCTQPGAIGAQPTLEQAEELLRKASFADV
eukprot:jgi/Astpho2/5596/fgenesh1_pm.00079_%23_26_t